MISQAAFVDGFPRELAASHPQAHAVIDAELRNCDELWITNPPPGHMFPAAHAASQPERHSWIPAALERFEWHADRGPGHEKWILYLRRFFSVLFRQWYGKAPLADEPAFERLARVAPVLHSGQSSVASCAEMGTFIASTLAARKTPLPPKTARHLHALTVHLLRTQELNASTFEIGFRLFRLGGSPIPWLRGVDLAAKPWNTLFDFATFSWYGGGGIPAKPAPRYLNAIGKVGEESVRRAISDSIAALANSQPVELSTAGVVMLRQMLFWMQAVPALLRAEPLYQLCGVRWQNPHFVTSVWIGPLLHAIARLERGSAFACVEALAHNPDTNVFRDAITLYDQFMAETLREVVVAEPRQEGKLGIDQFPIEGPMQQTLDDFLSACAPPEIEWGDRAVQTVSSARGTALDVIIRQAKCDLPGLIRAMNQRVQWLAKTAPVIAKGQPMPMPWLAWCCDIGALYRRVLDAEPELTAEDLAGVCRADQMNWMGLGPTRQLLAACERWIEKNGFDKQLTEAMENWQKHVQGSIAAQTLRKQIGELLWFDTAAPINEKACWSACIRRDLRTMPSTKQGPWIALLRNISPGAAYKPTKKWLKPGEKLFQQIGVDEFRTRLRAWFSPFQTGGPALKLTVAGRDILLALIWYSTLAKDPYIDEAVRWLATATWKAKADRDKALKLTGPWMYALCSHDTPGAIELIETRAQDNPAIIGGERYDGYAALCKRLGRVPRWARSSAPPPTPPKSVDEIMKEAVAKAMLASLDAEATENSFIVTNRDTGERYEVSNEGGRIRRLSDGKIVRIDVDWSRPPYSMVSRMCDGRDIAMPFGFDPLRSRMLLNLLSGSLDIKAPLIVDETAEDE